jgi:hypothetical protein
MPSSVGIGVADARTLKRSKGLSGGTPTDEGAKTISAVSKPTEGVSAAEEQLKEVKAVLVQLQDIFSEDDSAAAA